MAVIEIGINKEQIQNNNTTIFIKDNGVGFNMAYIDKLFGVFQRLHKEEEFEGTGIGLANVQQIIKKHHGSIRAVSEEKVGSSFYITL